MKHAVVFEMIWSCMQPFKHPISSLLQRNQSSVEEDRDVSAQNLLALLEHCRTWFLQDIAVLYKVQPGWKGWAKPAFEKILQHRCWPSFQGAVLAADAQGPGAAAGPQLVGAWCSSAQRFLTVDAGATGVAGHAAAALLLAAPAAAAVALVLPVAPIPLA